MLWSSSINYSPACSCSERPNFVSTKNINIDNTIKHIFYKVSYDIAKQNLLLANKTFGSAKVKKEIDQFIHVEFTSNVFRFIDDFEFDLTG
jgi:uncharacterized protein (DUF1499 family)